MVWQRMYSSVFVVLAVVSIAGFIGQDAAAADAVPTSTGSQQLDEIYKNYCTVSDEKIDAQKILGFLSEEVDFAKGIIITKVLEGGIFDRYGIKNGNIVAFKKVQDLNDDLTRSVKTNQRMIVIVHNSLDDWPSANMIQISGSDIISEIEKKSISQTKDLNSDDVESLLNAAEYKYKISFLGEAEKYALCSSALYGKIYGEGSEHAKRAASLLEAIQAEGRHRQELEILEQWSGKNDLKLVLSITNLARSLRNKGDNVGAEKLYLRALAIQEELLAPNSPDTSHTLNDLANLLYTKGDYAAAEPLYRRALAIREKALGPDHLYTVSSVNNLAGLLSTRGNYEDAEPLLRRALAIREKELGAEHPKTAAILHNLAVLLDNKREIAVAEPLFRRALAIREKVLGRDHPDTASTLNSLANLLRYKKGYKEAETLYRRALAIKKKVLGPQHAQTALVINNLANVMFDKGDHEGAEPLYRQALAIREETLGPNHPDTAQSLINLALLNSSKGDYEAAEPLYRRALAINEKVLGPAHPDTASILNNLAYFLSAIAENASALHLARKAAQAGYPGRSEYLQALYQTVGGKSDRLAESFKVIQSTMSSDAGSALRSLSVRMSAGSDKLAAAVRREQDLANELAALERAILAEVSKEPSQRNATHEQTIRDKTTDVTSELEQVRSRLAREFPEYAELARPSTIELGETQSLLSSDEALVVIDTVSDHGGDYAWVVTSTEADWRKLNTKPGEVDELVSSLLPNLNPDRQGEIDASLAHRLYRLTLTDMEGLFRDKKHLIFVLNGALTSLPPHILVISDAEGKPLAEQDWLIRRHAVSVMPTVSSLKMLRKWSVVSSAPRPMRAYADIAYSADGSGGSVQIASRSFAELFSGGIARVEEISKASLLPGTGREAKLVMRVLGGDAKEIVTGRAATEKDVKTAKLDDYRVLYFATHGLLAGVVEKAARVRAEPALLFAVPETPTVEDDGLLTASEVALLKLNADWVVLSACNTAAGGKPGAEALSGLARAFFYAGARGLLVSHWPVDDAIVPELMVRMFLNIRTNPGMRSAEAQRQAMLGVMSDAEHLQWVNPAYWAPFIIVGDPGN